MEAFIYTVIDMSLISVYCILVIMGLRLLMRKVPKTFSYMLWAIVFLRLILPIFPEAPVSLVPQSLTVTNTAAILEKSEAPSEVDAVVPDTAQIQHITSPDDLNAAAPLTNQDMIPGVTTPKSIIDNTNKDASSVNPENVSPGTILFLIWAAGFSLVGIYNVTSYIFLCRKIRDAVAYRDYRVSNRIDSPFVIGILRPVIYLPDGLSPNEQEFILQHEKTHIRRFDNLIKLITFFIVSVHWFNPLVWLAFALMNRDMEMSCDEAVIRSGGAAIRKGYSTTLLSMATGNNLLRPIPIAFGEGNIKMRIKNVLNYKKPSMWIITISLLAVIGISIGLFLNPMQNLSAKNTSAEASDPEITQVSDSEAFESIPVSDPYQEYSNNKDHYVSQIRSYTSMDTVDLTGFSELLASKGYTISAIKSTDKGDRVLEVTDADQKSSIVYTQFADKEDAVLAMDAYILALYEKFEECKEELGDNCINGPAHLGLENAMYACDINNMYKDNSVHIAYLSGSNFVEAIIPIETEYYGRSFSVDHYVPGEYPLQADRLVLFARMMEELGLGYPGSLQDPFAEQELFELPEKAILRQKDELVDILLEENLELLEITDNSFMMKDDENKMNVTFRILTDSEMNTLDRMYVMPVFDCASGAAFRDTETYQIYSNQIFDEYNVYTIWIQQENQLIEIDLKLIGSDEEIMEQREKQIEILRKLCFE